MTRSAVALLALAALAAPAAPAAGPTAEQEFLRKAGRAAEDSLKQLQSVTCLETVHQAKLDAKGKTVFEQDTSYDYLVVFQVTPDNLVFDESRAAMPEVKSKKKVEKERVALLITNGFPTFEFIFHPFFQNSYEFSAPELVDNDGTPALRVTFRHVHGARSPSVLKLKSREYPVEWQGAAWLDPKTGTIVRISASLLVPMEDVGLKTLSADVRFEPVRFKEDQTVHLLPATATIEAETLHQRWRNQHTFTGYRLFNVEVKSEVESQK